MRNFHFLIFALLILLIPVQSWAEEDHIQCAETEHRIMCNLVIPKFIETAQPLLSNGWENTLQINISLLNSTASRTIQRSRIEATQRCYLDPFDSPCLILWKGARNWQRYRDEAAFIKAMSSFGIQALTLKDLPADNYIVRIELQISASASKRLNAVRAWFRQNADSGSGFLGSNSLISSFLSSRVESAENKEIYTTTLDSTQFYIDISFDSQQIEQDIPQESEDSSTSP